MRLVDADYAQKELTIAEVEVKKNFETDCDHVRDFLNALPTVDAVPVVRCKDCAKFEQKGKYYNGTPFGYCYHWDYEPGLSPNEVDGDDFCSYGGRKEGAD